MSMFIKGKTKTDVMIINVHAPDLSCFHLLAQAVALDVISLFLCDEHNALLEKKALHSGAHLYLKKPFHMEIVKYLWQFVLKKRIQKRKAREELKDNRDQINIVNADVIVRNKIIEEKDIPNIEEQNNKIYEAQNDVVSKERYNLIRKGGRKSTKESNERVGQSNNNEIVTRKVYTNWTIDLHDKFMTAVQQLGEGRCFPKSILKAMNVPGLKRMQVASHLQKCRNNSWIAPGERKYSRRRSSQRSSSGSQQRTSFRKFWTIPHIQTNVTNMQQRQRNPKIQNGSGCPFSPLNANNVFARGVSSTLQQVYHTQLQVNPHFLEMGNSYNNPFMSAQNNIRGGLQQPSSF